MAADLMEHVIQERHAGADGADTAAIEAEGDAHVGLTGDAMDAAAAHDVPGLRALIRAPIMPGRGTTRRPRIKANLLNELMSKAQLMAFLAKAEADPTIQQRIDAAADGSAVVAIAREQGFLFSAASLARHLRG
jgi:predicted ribosomally synthesized peptide with nif11-like leader